MSQLTNLRILLGAMETPTRVLVVDDHQLIRAGVRSILAGTPKLFNVCGEASNGQEGVEKAEELKPDVVILDISMAVMDGLEAARRIRGLLPAAKIVMLSMHSSKQMADKAIQLGADAFVQKASVASDLIGTLTGLVLH